MSRGEGFAALIALGALSLGAGCGPGETGGTGGGGSGPPAWQVVYEGQELGGALLSAWGSGPDDVFVVGGPLGNAGFEAIALHFDGKAWTQLAPGGADSFWWVSGSGPSDVWMVGEHGRITHWDGASFTEHPRLVDATLWGAWAAGPSDAWIVGGTPEGGTDAPNDVVLHWDGQAWTQEKLPGTPLGRSLNKVWGTRSEDLYAVGEYGTVWHRKGTSWTLESDPPVAAATLLTVSGCGPNEVYAVGGTEVIRSDGATWSKVDAPLTNAVNGVTCGPASAQGAAAGAKEVLIVGFGGLKQRLVDGAWTDDFDAEPHGDLHGAWSDGAGAFWAAGGDFIAKPAAGKARRATIARYGSGQVPRLTP